MSNQTGVAGTGAGSSSTGPQEEFTVRIPRENWKKFTMMKFRSGANVDFTKLGEQPVKLERENNLKEYKTANDLDLMPKFGAGSEYGRDLKEESRRKKYGIMLKRYNPTDQPWLMKIGNGKQAKKFKGVREGTITENTSYYIFTKAADGAFEAFPVEQWYNFSPMIRYKYLNSEEAEEEYNKRHKNYFSIMQKYKVKKADDNADDEGEKNSSKDKKKKKSDLVLTDMEDWDSMQISDDDDDDDDDKEDDDDSMSKKKKKGKKFGKIKKKNAKQNSDDEAIEESDEGDYDDREVDYITDSGSDSSLSGPEDVKEQSNKYDDKGVDQEDGLRKILDSEEEDEEEEDKEKDDLDDEGQDKDKTKEEKKKGDDSSSSSSEDDSDIEKEAKLASELFLQDQKSKKGENEQSEPLTTSTESSVKQETPSSSNPLTDKQKALKRKAEKTPDGKLPTMKRYKTDDSEGITEDAIRRYLMRKPMTTKDLFLKFKSKKLNMSNEKITHVIAQLLKKINPDKSTINKKLYLSLKKPE